MSKEKVLETILVIVTGLLAIFIIVSYESNILSKKVNFLYISAFFISFLSLVSFLFAKSISFLWYKIADIMGFIMSKIILSIVFYLFLFPLSLFYRIFNKDALKLNRRNSSYYQNRNITYESKDLEHPW